MVELGTEKDILKKIIKASCELQKTKDFTTKMVLCNYITNLYSALYFINQKNNDNYIAKYPNEKKIFGNINNYQKFIKSQYFSNAKFNDNFILDKDFHSNYLLSVIAEIEDLDVSKDSFTDDEDNYLGEELFWDILLDFCKKLNIEDLFKEITTGKKIFDIDSSYDKDNSDGLTVHNPLTGETNILINNFSYDLDTLFTLVHELGHCYDLREFNSKDNIDEYQKYTNSSIYNETVSRMFERLFIYYLINNNIVLDQAINKLIEMEIINYNYLFETYIITMLKDYYLEKNRYKRLDNSDIYKMVKKDVDCEEECFGEMFNNLDLFNDINYAYGDIISMFLADSVIALGLDENPMFKRFMNIRYKGFNKDFILEEDLTADKYRELYEKELALTNRNVMQYKK